jgi:predicted aconitase with swiveling domain
MKKLYRARKVVRGNAEGEAIVCPDSFAFMGDVDMGTGEIVAAGNPNKGRRLKGRILIYKETKGSSGGCAVIMALGRQGIAPAALVTMKAADYNMTEGAIEARVPFVCCPDGDVLSEVKTGQRVRVDADAGSIEVLD